MYISYINEIFKMKYITDISSVLDIHSISYISDILKIKNIFYILIRNLPFYLNQNLQPRGDLSKLIYHLCN